MDILCPVCTQHEQKEYIARMHLDGEWGDELNIRAFADMFGMTYYA